MADLRIVDAPEIPTENITGEEKLPTGGSGNYSISLDSLADYTKTKKDLADNTTVDSKVGGVRQELDAHIGDLINPHQVTKGQIGLGNVDNTADADKPVSNSTQAAIISAVASKADKTYVDGQLTLKANKVDVYTKAETYTKQESSDLLSSSISTVLTPVNDSLDLAKRGIANRYDSSLTYNIGERVVLTNSDIVKSLVNGNANDPNSNMDCWYNFESLITTKTNCYVTPENYGLRNGDWTEAIQWCINTGKEVVLSESVYNISKPIYLSNLQHKIRGVGGKVSVINKIGDTKLGLPDVTRDGKTFNIDKDAVFICYNEGHQQLNFEHFRVQKNYREDELYTGYGLFAPFVSEFVNIDFFSWFVYYGFYTIDCWMSTWIRCHANAKAGFVMGGLDSDSDFLRGGTSLSLISCWSTNTGANESAYSINGFAYSNAISCGSDNIGAEGNPAFATWKFTNCPSFNLLSCGGEVISAKHLFYAANSQVDVKSHYITHFYNKYRDADAPYLIYALGSAKITVSNSTIPFVYDVLSDYPNFAAADYASYVSIDECKHYPPITGNNFGNFGVYSIRGSHIKFSNGGYSFEESNRTTNPNVANFIIGDNINIASNSNASSGTFGLVGNAGRWDTSLMRIGDVRLWWDQTTEVLRAKNFSNPNSTTDGYILGGCQKGTTAQRPTTLTAGMLYLDTTLAPNGKPIWSSAANTWVDATGTVV